MTTLVLNQDLVLNYSCAYIVFIGDWQAGIQNDFYFYFTFYFLVIKQMLLSKATYK